MILIWRKKLYITNHNNNNKLKKNNNNSTGRFLLLMLSVEKSRGLQFWSPCHGTFGVCSLGLNSHSTKTFCVCLSFCWPCVPNFSAVFLSRAHAQYRQTRGTTKSLASCLRRPNYCDDRRLSSHRGRTAQLCHYCSTVERHSNPQKCT